MTEEIVVNGLNQIKANCLGCTSQSKKEVKRRKKETMLKDIASTKQYMAEQKQKRKAEKEALKNLSAEEILQRKELKKAERKKKLEEKKNKENSSSSTDEEQPKSKPVVSQKRKRGQVELTKDEEESTKTRISPENPKLMLIEKTGQLRVSGTCPRCENEVSCFVKANQVSDRDLEEHLKMSREEYIKLIEQKKQSLKKSD